MVNVDEEALTNVTQIVAQGYKDFYLVEKHGSNIIPHLPTEPTINSGGSKPPMTIASQAPSGFEKGFPFRIKAA